MVARFKPSDHIIPRELHWLLVEQRVLCKPLTRVVHQCVRRISYNPSCHQFRADRARDVLDRLLPVLMYAVLWIRTRVHGRTYRFHCWTAGMEQPNN